MSEETGDGDTTGDGDGDGDAGGLSHAADIQKIWDTNCVGCHNPDGVAPILDLSGDAYDNIVGSLSAQATTTQLIEVGNSGDSYLVAKLRGAQADFEGGTGTQMPSGMNPIVPLPESTIETIETWIDEGALP